MLGLGLGLTLSGSSGGASAPPDPPVISVAPVVSGSTVQGSTLSCTTGTWTNSPSSYAYQWKRDDVDLSGETNSTYATVVGDIGTTITCAVTASNAGGAGSPSASNGIAVVAIDTTPSAFTFTDITNATLSTQYTSNTITVAGINSAANITITGGTYSINGGAYTSSAGTVVNGDQVSVRVTSSGSNSTAVNVVLTIGGVSDTYTVTTAAGIGSHADLGTFFTGSNTNAVTGTLVAAASIGDLVIVAASYVRSTGTIDSVTDSKSNTYTPLTQASTAEGTAGNLRFFYSFITAALTTSDTITATMSGTNSNTKLMQVNKISGVTTLDSQNTATGSSASPSAAIPSSGTFGASNVVVFAAVKIGAGTISSMPTSFSDGVGDTIGNTWGLAYRILNSNAQITPAWTSSTSGAWAAVYAAFR